MNCQTSSYAESKGSATEKSVQSVKYVKSEDNSVEATVAPHLELDRVCGESKKADAISKPKWDLETLVSVESECKDVNVIPTKEQKPCLCTTCGAVFTDVDTFNRHMKSHKYENPFKCAVCEEAFRKGNDLRIHMKTHARVIYHGTEDDSSKTVEGYSRKYMLIQTGETPYLCAICGMHFNQENDLKSHTTIHTGENFKSHMRIHTGDRPKPFHCTICERRFGDNWALQKHKRIHTGEKPHHCTLCDARFAQKVNFDRHMRIHTGAKPYHCTVCDARFAQKVSIENHMRIHTGEKPFHCTKCEKQFRTLGTLLNHTRRSRIHGSEKPQHCNFCNAQFTNIIGLKAHMKTHIGEKPFEPAGTQRWINVGSTLVGLDQH